MHRAGIGRVGIHLHVAIMALATHEERLAHLLAANPLTDDHQKERRPSFNSLDRCASDGDGGGSALTLGEQLKKIALLAAPDPAMDGVLAAEKAWAAAAAARAGEWSPARLQRLVRGRTPSEARTEALPALWRSLGLPLEGPHGRARPGHGAATSPARAPLPATPARARPGHGTAPLLARAPPLAGRHELDRDPPAAAAAADGGASRKTRRRRR